MVAALLERELRVAILRERVSFRRNIILKEGKL